MLESPELLKQSDGLNHDNEKVLPVPGLSPLELVQRLHELLQDDWIRIFTGGSVYFPTDKKLARGG